MRVCYIFLSSKSHNNYLETVISTIASTWPANETLRIHSIFHAVHFSSRGLLYFCAAGGIFVKYTWINIQYIRRARQLPFREKHYARKARQSALNLCLEMASWRSCDWCTSMNLSRRYFTIALCSALFIYELW